MWIRDICGDLLCVTPFAYIGIKLGSKRASLYTAQVRRSFVAVSFVLHSLSSLICNCFMRLQLAIPFVVRERVRCSSTASLLSVSMHVFYIACACTCEWPKSLVMHEMASCIGCIDLWVCDLQPERILNCAFGFRCLFYPPCCLVQVSTCMLHAYIMSGHSFCIYRYKAWLEESKFIHRSACNSICSAWACEVFIDS